MVTVMVAHVHLVMKVTIAKQISMSVQMVIAIVTLMLSVQTMMDHTFAHVTMDMKGMDSNARISMSVLTVKAIVT
jgi:hypothetical protein